MITNWWKQIVTKHPWYVIAAAAVVFVASAWYGAGLFGDLATSDNFTASNTESMQAKQQMERAFGASPSTEIILFERKDASLGRADSAEYQAQVAHILEPLQNRVDSITTYQTSGRGELISKDGTMTYAAIVGRGSDKEIYATLSDFAKQADQSKLKVSVGGTAATLRQMTDRVGTDLVNIELVTFPILLVLLILFFGSAVAALVPLGISIVTVAGAFALTRLGSGIIPIDHYAVNVITILGIGLSIDYALLSVNRFREELHHGSVQRAVRLVVDTSGRTIFFSAITVIACIISLVVFPLDFLHSVAIGGASAIAIAMLFTVLVLPAVLMVLGNKIDAWHLPFIKKKKGASRVWTRIAHVTTAHPIITLVCATVLIAVSLLPLGSFKLAGTMTDYRYLARGSTSRDVSRLMTNEFNTQSPSITGVLTGIDGTTKDERLQLACDITEKIKHVDGVATVISAAPLQAGLTCDQLRAMSAMNMVPAQLAAVMNDNMRNDALRVSVVLSGSLGTDQADKTLLAIRDIAPQKGDWFVGGMGGYSYDTNQMYAHGIPFALGAIALGMIVLLTFLLASFIIPLQAVLINALSLALSFACVVGVFQLGWINGITGWESVQGIVITPIILIVAIAFGLAMDYSVFLYSRMYEVHQKTADPLKAVQQGIIKTGPIITAAALMVFVVVIAFAFSGVVMMQMIGVGLGVAVIVDAFFVRLLLVPSIMALMGKASWYAPTWLKKIQIRHE